MNEYVVEKIHDPVLKNILEFFVPFEGVYLSCSGRIFSFDDREQLVFPREQYAWRFEYCFKGEETSKKLLDRLGGFEGRNYDFPLFFLADVMKKEEMKGILTDDEFTNLTSGTIYINGFLNNTAENADEIIKKGVFTVDQYIFFKEGTEYLVKFHPFFKEHTKNKVLKLVQPLENSKLLLGSLVHKIHEGYFLNDEVFSAVVQQVFSSYGFPEVEPLRIFEVDFDVFRAFFKDLCEEKNVDQFVKKNFIKNLYNTITRESNILREHIVASDRNFAIEEILLVDAYSILQQNNVVKDSKRIVQELIKQVNSDLVRGVDEEIFESLPLYFLLNFMNDNGLLSDDSLSYDFLNGLLKEWEQPRNSTHMVRCGFHHRPCDRKKSVMDLEASLLLSAFSSHSSDSEWCKNTLSFFVEMYSNHINEVISVEEWSNAVRDEVFEPVVSPSLMVPLMKKD